MHKIYRKPFSQRLPTYCLYVYCGIVFFLLIAPIFIVIPISFSSSRFLQFPPPGFSFQWYQNYFGSRDWMEATLTSFQVASLTCVFATILGTMLSVVLVRAKFPGKNLIYAISLSPIIIPLIITAIAIYFFYSKIHLVGTKIGIVIAHTVHSLPYVVVLVSSTLKGFDDTLERASLSLGASPLKTFLLVVFPIIRPGVLSGALFAFISSFDELVMVIFIAGTHAVTLPKRMWDGIRLEIDPTIAAVASLVIVMTVAFMVANELLRKLQQKER